MRSQLVNAGANIDNRSVLGFLVDFVFKVFPSTLVCWSEFIDVQLDAQFGSLRDAFEPLVQNITDLDIMECYEDGAFREPPLRAFFMRKIRKNVQRDEEVIDEEDDEERDDDTHNFIPSENQPELFFLKRKKCKKKEKDSKM